MLHKLGLKKQHEEGQKQRVAEVLDAAFADYGHGRSERAKIHRNDVDDGERSRDPHPRPPHVSSCIAQVRIFYHDGCLKQGVWVCGCGRGHGFLVYHSDGSGGEGSWRGG